MEMNKTSKGAGVLLIAVALILSTVAVTAGTQEQALSTNCTGSGTAPGAIGPVLWDNGMDYSGLSAAQYDASIQFDTYQADDFHFEELTEVADVHWIAGYWNTDYQTGDFDWCISFYMDDGSGDAPAGEPQSPSYAGPFCFTWDEIGKELLEDSGTSIYYECWVDLPEIITFEPCEKYWISIWGEGAFPPQSGWGYHQDFLLSPAVWGSVYFGFPFWTPGVDVLGHDFDNCFQLTGVTEPTPPTPPIIDGPAEGVAGTEICWTFHSSDENGDQVKYEIDWGDGTTTTTDYADECTPVEACHTYESTGDYVITAYAEDETGLAGGSSTKDIVIPRTRSVNHPLLQLLFERFPNVFPVLRQLLGL
jgi:hypothetical protein